MIKPLTHIPDEHFKSFLGMRIETDLDRIEGGFAILGAPFGSP